MKEALSMCPGLFRASQASSCSLGYTPDLRQGHMDALLPF